MEFLWNLASFILALGILVTIHEYGHFWVARKFGVKVLTFSVGFGKPILQKIGKDGVRYVIAAIPLGGFVKMLDGRDPEQQISDKDQAAAFNNQSVWARMAIVLAGPMANFLLAIFLYWLMFVIGIKGLSPHVGQVPETSISYQAGLLEGDIITQIDGEPVVDMQGVTKAIAKRLGETTEIVISVKRAGEHIAKELVLDISSWQVDESEPELLKSLGIYHPWETLEAVEAVIGSIVDGGVAEQAGLMVNDKIVTIGSDVISKWQDMKNIIASNPNQRLLFEVERNGELIPIFVVIGSAKVNGKEIGQIGVGAVDYTIVRKAEIIDAFGLAFDEMIKMVVLSSKLFIKFISGDISTKSLSGPISIAEGAGTTASIGLVYFISFLAMISVNLGFINLLPVPMLDGGHLLYFVIEAIKGKPLSQKVQEFGLQIGMMLVFALMALAIFNDILRNL